MEFFGSAFTLVVGYGVPFLFVLTIVVFFHVGRRFHPRQVGPRALHAAYDA